jgi:hypothetical protein
MADSKDTDVTTAMVEAAVPILLSFSKETDDPRRVVETLLHHALAARFGPQRIGYDEGSNGGKRKPIVSWRGQLYIFENDETAAAFIERPDPSGLPAR